MDFKLTIISLVYIHGTSKSNEVVYRQNDITEVKFVDLSFEQMYFEQTVGRLGLELDRLMRRDRYQ